MHLPGSPAEFAALLVAFGLLLPCVPRLGPGLVALMASGEALGFAIIGNVTMPFAITAVAAALAVHGIDPRRARSFARECALLLAGLAAYTLARMIIESEPPPALANARDIVAFEEALGLFAEPQIQDVVIRSEALTRGFNWFYSFGFLAFIVAALIWLWGIDSPSYRFLRNALGLSVLPAVATIALFPVAPPRLLAESGMIDTVAVLGRQHAYSNEFAAVPSLHVGWMVVTGVALGMAVGGRWRWFVAAAPGSMMLLTVIVTGNHFWIDGIVGAAYSLLFLALTPAARVTGAVLARTRPLARAARRIGLEIAAVILAPRVALSMIALGALIAYMAGMQVTRPGFTDFWGYLFGQVIFVTVLLLFAEILFARQGGLSIATHFIAVACCYADVFGTDGNLYANIDEYDKLTHFAGVAAITAGVYDGLRCMRMRGWVQLAQPERLVAAIAAGFAVGVAWEVYEFIGDKAFQTLRVQSKWDTANDIVSDAAGAISIALVLWLGESSRSEAESATGMDTIAETSNRDGV